MISFLDLGAATRELKTDIDAAVARVVDSGRKKATPWPPATSSRAVCAHSSKRSAVAPSAGKAAMPIKHWG